MNTPIDTYFDRAVLQIVRTHVDNIDDESRDLLLSVTRDDMIQFHHTVGRDIRNDYGLWLSDCILTKPWRDAIVVDNITDVEDHPRHPDAISMQALYCIWDLVNGLPPSPAI